MDVRNVYAVVKRQLPPYNTEVFSAVRMLNRPAGAVKAINDFYAQIGNTILQSNWKNEFASLVFEKLTPFKLLTDEIYRSTINWLAMAYS